MEVSLWIVILLLSIYICHCQRLTGSEMDSRIVQAPPGQIPPLDQFDTPTPGGSTYMALQFQEETSGTLLRIDLGVYKDPAHEWRAGDPAERGPEIQLWHRAAIHRGRSGEDWPELEPSPEQMPDHVFKLVEHFRISDHDMTSEHKISLVKELKRRRGRSPESWCLLVRPGDWIAIYIPYHSTTIQVPYSKKRGRTLKADMKMPDVIQPFTSVMENIPDPEMPFGGDEMTFSEMDHQMEFPITANVYHEAVDHLPNDMNYIKCPQAESLRATTKNQDNTPSTATGIYAAIGVISIVALVAIMTSTIVCLRYKKQKSKAAPPAQRTDSMMPIYVDSKHISLGLSESIQLPDGLKMQRNSVYGLKCHVSQRDSTDTNISYIMIPEDMLVFGEYEDIKNILTRQNSAADPEPPKPPERFLSTESNPSGSKAHTYLILRPDNDSGMIDMNSSGSENSFGRSSRLTSVSDSDQASSEPASLASSVKHKILKQQESGPYCKIED